MASRPTRHRIQAHAVLMATASGIVQVPLWLDLLAVFAGAVGGAVFAVRRGFDIAGVFALRW